MADIQLQVQNLKSALIKVDFDKDKDMLAVKVEYQSSTPDQMADNLFEFLRNLADFANIWIYCKPEVWTRQISFTKHPFGNYGLWISQYYGLPVVPQTWNRKGWFGWQYTKKHELHDFAGNKYTVQQKPESNSYECPCDAVQRPSIFKQLCKLAKPMKSKNNEESIVQGVDVSDRQFEIDWQKAKNFGIDAAIICASTGVFDRDPLFIENWMNAKKNGVLVAANHRFYALANVQKQVDNVGRALKDVGFDKDNDMLAITIAPYAPDNMEKHDKPTPDQSADYLFDFLNHFKGYNLWINCEANYWANQVSWKRHDFSQYGLWIGKLDPRDPIPATWQSKGWFGRQDANFTRKVPGFTRYVFLDKYRVVHKDGLIRRAVLETKIHIEKSVFFQIRSEGLSEKVQHSSNEVCNKKQPGWMTTKIKAVKCLLSFLPCTSC
uniref:Uncharacterized protein n=1 Tax=Ditylenchus dipsaci TaxID=166011 RepID=A0A915EME4_9BILA